MRTAVCLSFVKVAAAAALLPCASCRPRNRQHPAPPPPPAVVSHAPAARPKRVQDPTPPATNASVFALSHRGITSQEPDLWPGSASGWGSGYSESDKYIERLKSKLDVRPVHNPHLTGREWCGLERNDDEVVALHIDINGNRKPDEGERILPSAIPESHYLSRRDCKLFFTPDMQLPGEEGEPEPYRMFLRVEAGNTGCPMWSSASLWTGPGDIDGVACRVLLRDGSLRGGVRTFGRAGFAIQSLEESTKKARLEWQRLSRIIHLGERFMRLRFLGTESRAQDFRLVLEPYGGATGKLRMALLNANSDKQPATCSYVTLKGESDPDVHLGFAVTESIVEAPSARYTLSYAKLSYGADGDTWSCRLKGCSNVVIGTGDTNTLALGPPSLAVVAVDANRRYSSSVKPATEFAATQDVYLSPEVKGPRGETFSNFYRPTAKRRSSAATPSLRITDADGNELVATTLEYG